MNKKATSSQKMDRISPIEGDNMLLKCPTCGGEIEPKSIKGTTKRHKTMFMTFPSDVMIDTCTKCGAQYIGKKEAIAVDSALQPLYEAELQRKAQDLINGLITYTRQWNIEFLLGLSFGYISRIKNGKKLPSPALVAALALLSSVPQERLSELESFWGVGSLDKRYEDMMEFWRKEEEEHV